MRILALPKNASLGEEHLFVAEYVRPISGNMPGHQLENGTLIRRTREGLLEITRNHPLIIYSHKYELFQKPEEINLQEMRWLTLYQNITEIIG